MNQVANVHFVNGYLLQDRVFWSDRDLKSDKGRIFFDKFLFFLYTGMASVGIEPSAAVRDSSENTTDVDRLPEEMNDMKIQDDKVCFFFMLMLFSDCVSSLLQWFCVFLTDLIDDH